MIIELDFVVIFFRLSFKFIIFNEMILVIIFKFLFEKWDKNNIYFVGCEKYNSVCM